MHELGIALRIVEIASNIAEREGLDCVSEVALEIGELAGVVPEALYLSYEVASLNTILENTRLSISVITAKARCQACGKEFIPKGFLTVCPDCGTFECEIIRGKELHIRSIISGDGKHPSKN